MNVGSVTEALPISSLVGASGAISTAAEVTPRANQMAGERKTPAEEPSKADLRRMAEEMQKHIEQMNVNLKFTTYGEHGERIAIMVVNGETGEVIREIPPEEIQALYQRMSELVGMLFNRNV